ncbi:MAG: hypothetical protein DWP92_00680 [Armatimonadetes bacterium]|nr:MAG: hypothetical protein DWP92_00680 [Armatimonadota bacterium]
MERFVQLVVVGDVGHMSGASWAVMSLWMIIAIIVIVAMLMPRRAYGNPTKPTEKALGSRKTVLPWTD